MATAILSDSAESDLQGEQPTLADLVHRLGDVPLGRIRLRPPPGTATEEDALATEHCELIDGVLVEKAMGYPQSRVGQVIAAYLEVWLAVTKVGFVIGEGAFTRMRTGNMRIPDACVTLWNRVPDRTVPQNAITDVVPDIAIEVLSPGNTEREIERKRGEFFSSGTKQVWIVRPARQTIDVWTSPKAMTVLTLDDVLRGDPELPGFELSVREIFDAAARGQINLDLVRNWLN